MKFFKAALVCALCMGSFAYAEDPFSLVARSTSGPPVTAGASGSNVVDLVSNFIERSDQFRQLAGQDFVGALKYAGLSNAVLFSENAAGTQATLTIPSTGFQRTFTAANSDQLNDQIRDFIKKEGSDEWSRFLRSVNEQSPDGLTDGNPQATTAFLADNAYNTFGLSAAPYSSQPPMGDDGQDHQFRFDLSGGFTNTDTSNGYYATATLTSAWWLSDRFALVLSVPFMYRNIEDANIFNLGSTVGLPIVLIPSRGDRTLDWTITPAGVFAVAGSYDFAAGGLMYGASATSRLSYRLGSLTITMANQYGFYEGTDIEVGDYRFSTDLSQQILKNGLQLRQTFDNRFFIDGSLTYTNFLKSAAVDSYFTPSLGFGWLFSPASSLRLAYAADLGDGYTAHSGVLQFNVSY